MKNKNRIVQMTTALLALLVCALCLSAQEPPPRPNATVMAAGPFITRIEGRSMNKVVKGAPYSAQAITETDQTLADGNEIHRQTTANVYRDSKGRTRREETLGDFGPWSTAQTNPKQIIWINDPVAGVRYMLDPDRQTAVKFPAEKTLTGPASKEDLKSGPGQDSGQVFISGPPPEGAAGKEFFFATTNGDEGMNAEFVGRDEPGATESLGTQTMEGVKVTGTRTTFTIPAGQIGNDLPIKIVTERWSSPALQTVVMSKRSDPRVGVTTYRLTNISLTEPSPDLFQVPSDYTVKSGPATFEFRQRTTSSSNQ